MKLNTFSITIYLLLFAVFFSALGILLIKPISEKSHTTNAYQANDTTAINSMLTNSNHQNWTESTFIEHMIPHHEEAISQSKMMITKTQNIKYKAILSNIIEVQTREVGAMKQWYQSWNSKPYEDKGVYEPMMSEIYTYTGKILEREWLQSMVYHHQAAIYMSQSGLKTIHKEELRDLMENIKISQGAQIIEMETLINEIRGN
jgi:uncharacterized protein (DUF305 family)